MENCGQKTTWETLASLEDNIEMDLHEMGCGGKDCIDVAKDRDRW